MRKILYLVFMIFLWGGAIYFNNQLIAQSLEQKLEVFDKKNTQGYLQPLANTMGAGLNSGLFTTAKVLSPFAPRVVISSTVVSIPSSAKSFMATPPKHPYASKEPPPYTYRQEKVKTATVFGNKGGTFIADQGGTEDIALPNGANISAFPLPFASVSLGLPMGNEVMLRGLPPMSIDQDLGDTYFWGLGLKHDLTQWVPGLKYTPFDLAMQGVYQNMSIADFVQINSFSVNLQGSFNFLMFGVYSGIGYENATLEAKYKYNSLGSGRVTQKVRIDADNDFTLTLGGKFKPLPMISVFYDYTYANTPSMNFGLGVGF